MASLGSIVNSGKLHLVQHEKWVVAPKETNKISLDVFARSAQELVSHQSEILSAASPAQILQYIQLFNTAWTTAKLAQNKISASPKGNNKPIQFSSFSKQYSWLSNFFQTLIFDESKRRILSHVEGGYVAFKAEQAEESEFIEGVIQEFDPATAKAIGSHLERPKTAIDEMYRLEVLKFAQNPVLTNLLKNSGTAPLEEYTSDSFWGTAHGTIRSDESNQLGRILELVRATL